MKRAVALLGLVLWAQAGWGGGTFINGNELLSKCSEEADNRHWGVCSGYISSASDVYETLLEWKEVELRHCLPEGVRVRQLEQVVLKYLNEHPEKLHRAASGLVLNALYEAFPCK
jgi:hypothetical protein